MNEKLGYGGGVCFGVVWLYIVVWYLGVDWRLIVRKCMYNCCFFCGEMFCLFIVWIIVIFKFVVILIIKGVLE